MTLQVTLDNVPLVDKQGDAQYVKDQANHEVAVDVLRRLFPDTGKPSTSTAAALKKLNVQVVDEERPEPEWYYGMIDCIEPGFNEDGVSGVSGVYYVADCVPVTYFEAMATHFSEFYPADVDLSGASYNKVYGAKIDPRRLGGSKRNGDHRTAVEKFLANADRFLLIRWFDRTGSFKSLQVQTWYLFGIDPNGKQGITVDSYLHSDIFQQDETPQPGKTVVTAILDFGNQSPTARRLLRVISLDFVSEIDFGGPDPLDTTDPPLNPVILPSGPGSVTVVGRNVPIVAARVDGTWPTNPLPMRTKKGKKGKKSVSVTFVQGQTLKRKSPSENDPSADETYEPTTTKKTKLPGNVEPMSPGQPLFDPPTTTSMEVEPGPSKLQQQQQQQQPQRRIVVPKTKSSVKRRKPLEERTNILS